MKVVSLVLAAGQGTRMRSRTPKVLHPVAGRPMLLRALDAVAPLADRTVVVVGPTREACADLLSGMDVETALQEERRGTGDAVRCARRALEGGDGTLLVTFGDVPLVRTRTLEALLAAHHETAAAATVLTAFPEDPYGYGRVVREEDGRISAIVEERDADDEQRALREINTGVCAFRLADLWPALERIGSDNAQGEVYLTEVFSLLHADGKVVAGLPAEDPGEIMGINTRADLARASRIAWDRNLDRLMAQGVTILDPLNTYVSDETRGASDVVIHPGTVLEGRNVLDAGSEAGPWTRLRDCHLGEGAQVLDHCVLEKTRLEAAAVVGPFSRMRDGVEIGAGAQVGNFVEVKGSSLGAGTKAKHLAYLGNATIGEGVNIGAGTITCNHDGFHKHPTTLKDGAYVGSNSTLIAPVQVGEGAYVAAGSVINRDVPADALGIARCRPEIKEGWAARRRAREAKKKEG